MSQAVADLPAEDETQVDAGDSMGGSDCSDEVDIVIEKVEKKLTIVAPPGTGQGIYEIDPLLKAHRTHLDYR